MLTEAIRHNALLYLGGIVLLGYIAYVAYVERRDRRPRR